MTKRKNEIKNCNSKAKPNEIDVNEVADLPVFQ